VLRLPANAPDNKWLYTGAAGTGGVVLGALGKWAADQRKPVPGTEPAKKGESKKEETPESTKKEKWIEACTSFVILSEKLRLFFVPSYFDKSENRVLRELPNKIFDFTTEGLYISDPNNPYAQDRRSIYKAKAKEVQRGIDQVTAGESYALVERPPPSGVLPSKFATFDGSSSVITRRSNVSDIKKTAEQIIQAKETIEQNKGWIDSIQ
jgi:hypothetical protein